MVAHASPDPLQQARPREPEPEPEPENGWPDPATRPQDSFRKVMLGQVSDPIFPATTQPAPVSEEELASQALHDRGSRTRSHGLAYQPLWRWLSVVLLGSIVLLLALR